MSSDRTLSLISGPAGIDLLRSLVPNIASGISAIDLVVKLDADDLNLRDLSRFFTLVDRAYGRVLHGDLRKYAWDEASQLHIARVNAGSWEVVLTQVLQVIPDPTPILVIYVLLRLLPKAFKESADGVLKLSTAYNNYEQARLARANRKSLRAQMEKDVELQQLNAQRKQQLAEVVDRLVREDPSVSNPALDFAAKSFRSVDIRIRPPEEPRHDKQNVES